MILCAIHSLIIQFKFLKRHPVLGSLLKGLKRTRPTEAPSVA